MKRRPSSGAVSRLSRQAGTQRKEVRGLGRRTGLRPTPQLWEVPTVSNTMPRVGLDVHAKQTHLFSLDLATGEAIRRRIEGPPEAVLAHLGRIGEELIAVYEAGPTGFGLARAAEERFRDLLRCREDLRGDLMRARHRLSKLLLRHGLRFPGPGRNWTVAHHRWL